MIFDDVTLIFVAGKTDTLKTKSHIMFSQVLHLNGQMKDC